MLDNWLIDAANWICEKNTTVMIQIIFVLLKEVRKFVQIQWDQVILEIIQALPKSIDSVPETKEQLY